MADRRIWSIIVQPIRRMWPDPINAPETFNDVAAEPRSLLVLASDDGLVAYTKARDSMLEPEPHDDGEGNTVQVVSVALLAMGVGQTIDLL